MIRLIVGASEVLAFLSIVTLIVLGARWLYEKVTED